MRLWRHRAIVCSLLPPGLRLTSEQSRAVLRTLHARPKRLKRIGRMHKASFSKIAKYPTSRNFPRGSRSSAAIWKPSAASLRSSWRAIPSLIRHAKIAGRNVCWRSTALITPLHAAPSQPNGRSGRLRRPTNCRLSFPQTSLPLASMHRFLTIQALQTSPLRRRIAQTRLAKKRPCPTRKFNSCAVMMM